MKLDAISLSKLRHGLPPVPRILGALLLVHGLGAAAKAQILDPSLVPADHAVYEWLRYMRLRGWLADFPFESRPLSRTEIGRQLAALRDRPLDPVERTWWRRFALEFAPESGLSEQTSLRRPWEGFDRDSTRYLYHERSPDYALYVNLLGGADGRWVRAQSGPLWGQVWTGGVRVRAALSGGWAATADVRAGYLLAGKAQVLGYDPFWRNLYKVRQEQDRSGDAAVAAVSWRRSRWALDLLHGHLLYGAGQDAGLVLTSQPGYYTAFRAQVGFSRLRYQGALAWLLDPPRRQVFPLDTSRFAYMSLPRYLQLHRIELIPHPRWRLAYTDLVVYGNRDLEPTYWLPFYPFVIAEHELWDRDNVLFSLESVWLPSRGWELTAAILVDDLDLLKLGTDHMSVKLAWQLGLGWSVRPEMALRFEYTRVEPYVYSHWIPYNSYTHNAVCLGHPLGPNSDQLYAGAEGWLAGLLRVRAAARYRRHGANLLDGAGKLVRNVGGDVLRGDYPPHKRKPFLDGVRQTWWETELALSWEARRGLWYTGEFFVRLPQRGPISRLVRAKVGFWMEL